MAQQPKEERVVEIIVNGTKANASLKEMAAAAAVLSNQVAKIAADDPKRGELIAQLQQMRQRITDTRAEVAGLLTAEQQLAAANQQLAESQAAAVVEQGRAIAAGKASTASYNEMKVAAGLLEQQLHKLGADDTGRGALLTDLQTLRGRLEEARTAMSGVIKTEAQQRAEAEALRAQELALAEAEARRRREQVELVVNGQRVTASMREMREAATQLQHELDELSQTDPARGPLIAALQQLRTRIHDVGEEVVGVTETTSRMQQVMNYAFGALIGGGIEGVIEKVLATGRAVFDTTAKFEKYGVILENALGSKSLAQKALADIKQLAIETPFSVDELTSSYLKLVNRGIQPSMAEMKNLADVAASQGKDFDQLAEALLDAGTGEFERLKELGIGASKAGDQVTLSFKNQQVVVANSPKAISAAIVSFGDLKGVMGSTDVIAQSLEGQLSNLGDAADQMAIAWGETLRPAFVAVLSTLGFVLGMLRAVPALLKENKGVLLALAGAVVTLNAEMVTFNLQLLAETVGLKAGLVWKAASTAATNVMTFSWKGLNAAMKANPIGFVIGLVMLLVGALVAAYEKSETFRGIVNGLGASLKAFVVTYVQGMITALTGLGDVLAGVFTGDWERIKKGVKEGFDGVKAVYVDAGVNAAKAFGQGYHEEEAKQASEANKRYQERLEQFKQTLKDSWEKLDKARKEAAKKARLETLKNEEADLKEKLARVAKDSEAELRLQQQLVTNEAAQKLQADKLTAAERRIILADALDKRVKLEQEYFDKAEKAAEAARKKRAEQALKARLADIEAEQLHQQMLAQVRQAAVAARGDELVTEMSKIYTEGQLKRAALEAEAKKEIARLVGTAEQKRQRTRDIEQKLAADKLLLQQEVQAKQGEYFDKYNKETYDKLRESVQQQVNLIEEGAAREEAAWEAPLHASFRLQQEYDELRYQARQAAFAKELDLIEKALGMQRAEFKKKAAEMEKDQQEHGKKAVKATDDEVRAKRKLRQLEMKTASDVLDFAVQLLDQDGEARKKHHGLYVALAAAKIIMDGAREVAAIWEYSAEQPENVPTAGGWGIALGTVQTAMAVGRTAIALSQVRGSLGGGGGGDNTSYAQGGATGSGAGLTGSAWGQLLAMTGASVGSDGRLRDGTGFAVAGVVHEDEYVIPKWQLQDPQVAAVTQWLEARRLRGFDGGGHTTSGSSGATLPVAAASPSTDGERTYAVLTQVLEANLAMVQQLGDVKQWQRDMQVHLNLRDVQARTQEYKQVQYNSAIRSKSAVGS